MLADIPTVVHISANPMVDLRQLLLHQFMVNALLAGTGIAIVTGAVGWFMVLRRQSFAAHCLAEISFTGVTGAALLGLGPEVGLLLIGLLAALGIGLLGHLQQPGAHAQAATIGTILAFGFGLGYFFLRLSPSSYGANITATLFGTILGVADRDVQVVAVTALFILGVLMVIGRPLYLASVFPLVAAARGVPVRLLDVLFLLLMAITTVQAVQVVGILLIFGLLVTPAATAQQLTPRPGYGVLLAVGLALGATWLGISLAYFTPYPVGFWVTTLAFGSYVITRLLRAIGQRLGSLDRPRRAVTSGEPGRHG